MNPDPDLKEVVQHVVAERLLLAKMRSGEIRQIRMQIGLPMPLDKQWEAEIALVGLYPHVVKVPGVDSFQCINLSFGVIRTALENFVDAGGLLYWRDGSGPLGLVELFS